MFRITLNKFAQRKISSCLNRDKWAHHVPLFNEPRKSPQTDGGCVYWEPSVDMMKAAIEILEHEQGFARKKEGCAYKAIAENINQLRAKVLELEPAPK